MSATPLPDRAPGTAAVGGWFARLQRWWRRRSLRQRLLWGIVLAAPAVWSAALLISADRARHEVNELFDTELIRLARQVQATLPSAALDADAIGAVPPAGREGEADIEDMAIAVWARGGRRLLVDREGAQLPYRADTSGFVELQIDGSAWRAYYLPALDGRWLVAAGQALDERDEVVSDLILSQIVPWLLMLPVLLAAMALAVRQALRPLDRLGAELARRRADELAPIDVQALPRDLQPLAGSMNALFARIDTTLERERRFTGDAAHELRTPLAALRAQWDAWRLRDAGTGSAVLDGDSAARIDAGLERMQRLLAQLLELSRVDHRTQLANPQPIDWPALLPPLLSELLPLASQKQVELEVEWPASGTALALEGDAGLLGVMLRNLLDNALRASPAGATVTLRLDTDRLEVLDRGPGVATADLARLGERFFRPAGDGSSGEGSGLGLSIAMRIAALHGLALELGPRVPGPGLVARLSPALADGEA